MNGSCVFFSSLFLHLFHRSKRNACTLCRESNSPCHGAPAFLACTVWRTHKACQRQCCCMTGLILGDPVRWGWLGCTTAWQGASVWAPSCPSACVAGQCMLLIAESCVGASWLFLGVSHPVTSVHCFFMRCGSRFYLMLHSVKSFALYMLLMPRLPWSSRFLPA